MQVLSHHPLRAIDAPFCEAPFNCCELQLQSLGRFSLPLHEEIEKLYAGFWVQVRKARDAALTTCR